MTALGPRKAAVQTDALQTRVARIGADIFRRVRAVRFALHRLAIRGQLGPSVGYPHDRYPEPPF